MHMPIPYFDAQVAEVDDTLEGSPEAVSDAKQAMRSFLALKPDDRGSATRHLAAYREDMFRAINEDAPAISEDELWAAVAPNMIFLMAGHDEDHATYVVAECDCEWEPEHGLMMVWREGRTLCKVGGYDGHVTNADAYADNRLERIVYRAFDPAFRTFLDQD